MGLTIKTIIMNMKKSIKKQFTKRGLWFTKKTPVLLDRWNQELKINVEFVIAHRLLVKTPLKFLQIGAFDGASNDFLASFIDRGLLRGVMVEPEPNAYNKLNKLYESSGEVDLLQCAIAKHNGNVIMYRVKQEYHHLAVFAPQLTSMDVNNIRKWMKGKIDNVEKVIESFSVPSLTVDEVIGRYKLVDLDVLQIDTEGFDAEIIKMLPLDKVKPSIISFEILNLSVEDKNHVYGILMDNGYMLSESIMDCVAYHKRCV